MPHLVVDISSHGYGHLAQVGPVLAAMKRIRPDLTVTARCALPEPVVRGRMPGLDRLIHADLDVGMVMASAMEVLSAESHQAHLAFHRDWGKKVRAAASELAALAPDLVLCDVPYLSIAAARHAGIPVVALCSLNWADIYRAYCAHLPGSRQILDQMTAAYAAVDLFVQATPHMPMNWLPRRQSVSPIAPEVAADEPGIRRRLGIAGDTRLLLVALGGIDTRLDLDRWPVIEGTTWLVPEAWRMAAPHILPTGASGPAFSSLLAAADLVLTKPGYGTFVEAGGHGVPVAYVERPDWPETPYLARWLKARVPAMEISMRAVRDGSLISDVQDILKTGRSPSTPLRGAAEAARMIDSLMGKKC